MTELPNALRTEIEEMLGASVFGATLVGGGMINRAAVIESGAGRFFVKWHTDPPTGFYEAEADGLARLRKYSRLRVPAVAGVSPRLLLLEYIEERPPSDIQVFTRNFAVALAETHRNTTSPDLRYGLDHDNYIGKLPQLNTSPVSSRSSWAAFYRDLRLRPQIDRARDGRLIDSSRERLLSQVVDQVEDLLDEYAQCPSLLHGDLWSGNYLTAGDTAALVDPAVYYGDREIEIAFIELFGGFPPDFVRAYSSEFPLDDGYRRRRPLLQLYPLLVHLNTFGETYGPAVDQVCRVYAGD